jgi:hypothetical protein
MRLLIILLFISITVSGQRNSVYVSLQPGDLGMGLRYDRSFHNSGIYTSLTKGSYHLNDGGYIHNHYKGALGYIYRLPKPLGIQIRNYASIGITYHNYGTKQYYFETIDPGNFKPLSFELGFGGSINRFITFIRFDVLKQEGCVDVGFKF